MLLLLDCFKVEKCMWEKYSSYHIELQHYRFHSLTGVLKYNTKSLQKQGQIKKLSRQVELQGGKAVFNTKTNWQNYGEGPGILSV